LTSVRKSDSLGVNMLKEQINKKHFQVLYEKFGNHTEAAKYLGITRPHYHYVRKTGKMSESLAKLILFLTHKDHYK